MDDVQKDHRPRGPYESASGSQRKGLHSKGKMLASGALAVPVHQTPRLAWTTVESLTPLSCKSLSAFFGCVQG